MAVQGTASTDVLSITFVNTATGQSSTIIDFINQAGGTAVDTNQNSGQFSFLSFTLEKDYFVPPNAFEFSIANLFTNNNTSAGGISSLIDFMQIGFQVQLKINDMLQMIGYIFDYHLTVNRHSGTILTVKCKDLLEYMAQGTCPPNLGSGQTTNYHFSPNSTISQVLTGIAAAFTSVTNVPIQIVTENAPTLTVTSGFQTGLRTKGTTPASRSKSLGTALSHLTTPSNGESYLAFMIRVAMHAGCNIKMADDNLGAIYCKPPTYDRDVESPFKLYHYLSSPNNQQNNVISAEYFFNGDKQPSIVVAEASTNGDGKFYQSAVKGVAINELTAYPVDTSVSFGNQSLSSPVPIASVINAQQQLCAGTEGTGWFLAPFNAQLYNIKKTFPIQIQTKTSLPFYTIDNNSHSVGSDGEVAYAASKILAECQDKYVEFVFHVAGWTMQNTPYVWQPDMMVQVVDESFNPGNPQTFNMWIRRVKYTKTRNGGTETELVCQLPYVHNFEATP